MPINLEVVIDTDDYSVEMKSGLETLKGISDATTYIASAIVSKSVPEKITPKNPIRTHLKKTFESSYGQNFSLEILDEGMRREYKKVGNIVFAELMDFFICEALYLDSKELSDKAKKVLEKMDVKVENLITQLRRSSLKNAHAISEDFDHDVKIRFKIKGERKIIASFNKETYKCFEATQDRETVNIKASITRLNIYTGNGRLTLEGEDETVAFGFGSLYKTIGVRLKQKLSANLDFNNTHAQDKWLLLNMDAYPIRLQDGKIIKYIVKGVLND